MANNFRIVATSLTALLSFAWFISVLPAQADNDINQTVDQNVSKPTAKFQGSVQKSLSDPPTDTITTGTNSGGTTALPIHKPMQLWAHLETSDNVGTVNQIMPTYQKNTGVTESDYNSLIASPLVQARLDEWKGWYAQIYDAMRPNTQFKIPAGVRAKVNVTVAKSGKVTAQLEWMDPTNDPAAKQCVQWVINNARALKPEVAQFPPNSYIPLIKLDIELNGRENKYVLSNLVKEGWQALDYDHD